MIDIFTSPPVPLKLSICICLHKAKAVYFSHFWENNGCFVSCGPHMFETVIPIILSSVLAYNSPANCNRKWGILITRGGSNKGHLFSRRWERAFHNRDMSPILGALFNQERGFQLTSERNLARSRLALWLAVQYILNFRNNSDILYCKWDQWYLTCITPKTELTEHAGQFSRQTKRENLIRSVKQNHMAASQLRNVPRCPFESPC